MPLARNPQRLQFAKLLHLERGDGADDSGGEWQSAGNDSARLDGRLERASAYLGTQGLKQRIARLRDSAGEYHDVGIEDVEEIRYAGAEKAGRLTNDLPRRGIAPLRRLVDRLR